MNVILDLSAVEVEALHKLADAAGVEIDAVIHSLIAQILPEVQAESGQGEHGPEEEAERRREQEEVEANIKRWHAEREPNPAQAPTFPKREGEELSK